MAARPIAVVVYKKSLWELQGRTLGARRLPAGERQTWRRSHAAHAAALAHVVRVLREEGFATVVQYRARLRPIRRAALVITLGGDGTFLRASHQVRAVPMLGVNSDPAHSVGFFCCATRANFRDKLRAFRRGRLPVVKLARLQIRLRGRLLPELALNDCLITHENPAATSRYRLQVGRRTESQASSGLWVATPSGSTAAARSAGGWVLPLGARGFEFVVREPFVRGKRPVHVWRGRVPRGTPLSVQSLMASGRLYIDGPHISYPFRWGDIAVIRTGTPLQAVGATRAGKSLRPLRRY